MRLFVVLISILVWSNAVQAGNGAEGGGAALPLLGKPGNSPKNSF